MKLKELLKPFSSRTKDDIDIDGGKYEPSEVPKSKSGTNPPGRSAGTTIICNNQKKDLKQLSHSLPSAHTRSKSGPCLSGPLSSTLKVTSPKMAPHTGTGNHHPVSVIAGDEIVVVTSEDGTKKTFESSSCERAPLTSYRSITLTIALELVTSLPFFNLCQKDTKDTYKEKIMSTTMATPVGSTATAAFTATASTTAAAPSATTAASATATATPTTTTATAAPTKSNYFQPIKSPRTDDEDIAKPVGGKKNQNYLMNILTSSLLATGLNQVTSPLRKLAGHPSPLAEEEEEPEEEGLQQPVMENLEDFELSGLLGSFDDIHPEDINDEDKKYLDEAILSAEATLADADTDPTHTNSIPTASSTTETMSTVSTEDSESLLLEDVEEKDVEELVSTTATVDESITPFQASVLERMNLTGILESIFTKFKGNNDYTITDGVKLRFAHKLQNELDLSDDDIFVDDYEALLANDVLLQGHVYLTQEALIFFAFLPKSLIMPGTHHPSSSAAHHKHHHSLHPSSHDNGYIIQDGSLAMKLIKPDAVFQRSHRHWVILREKTLSVYKSPTDLYFPELLIDLTTCLRIELEKCQPQRTSANTTTARRYSNEDVDSSPDGIREDLHDETIKTEAVWFKVISTSKTYKFFADNEYTARNWCSNLSKRIFVLSNSNDKGEVLVKIPLSRVVDFEKVNIMKDPFLEGPSIPNGFVVKFLEDPQPKESPNNLEGNEKATAPIQGGEATSSFLELTNYGIDEVFFLFLREGNSFFKKLQELLDERFNGSTDPFFNQKPISEKASVIFERNTAASGGNGDSQLESLKSTLAPQKQTYLMSQMILLSEKMMMTSSPTSSFSPALSRSTTPNTLMKLGRTLSARSRKLIAKRTDSCITTPSPGAGTRSPSGYQDICLPKSLSMTDLKKVQMSVSVSSKEVSNDEFADALDKKLDSLGLQGEGTIVDSYKDTITSSDLEPGTLTRTSTSEELIDRNSNTQLPVLVQPQPRRAENASLYFEVESSNSNSNYSPTNDDRKSNVLLTLGKAIGLGKPLKNMGHMWMAEPNHFLQMVENDPYYNVSNKEREQSFKNFIGHFLLPNEGRILLASYYVHLQRSVPVYGKLYLSNHELCFRSMLPGYSTKMILPLKDIENCFKEKGLILSFGLVVVIHGHEELFVDFSAASSRDDCEYMLLLRLEEIHRDEVWSPKNSDWGPNYDTQIGVERMELLPNISQPTVSGDCKSTEEVAALAISNTRIENARMKLFEDRLEAAAGINIPLILEDSPFYKLEVKPTTSFNITILTIGSRGDVQPYLALAKGLLKEGHHVTIATHLEFKEWIEKHNVGFKEIAGNPAELMNLMVTHGSLSVGFLREANSKFKTFINELLKSSWEACQGADLLIESPSAMAGIHIAEALGIPYMRAFTMPWTRTRAYPHAFIVPDQKKGGSYNYLTHVIFETVFWKGISGQVNKWRVNDLGLARTSLYQMQQFKTPFLYNVSPTIFPPSVDFPDWVRVTGYWFLDEGTSESYEPPEELVKFLQAAFEDGKKIVYIGFGSIVVNDSKSLTQAVVDAVLDADVRCILNKGWSDRLNKKDKNESDIVLPPEIFSSGNVPHDWLFSRIDAAVHHGGSGTTGATLRAGIPTIIKPFFGDQFFYANRVEDVGVGIALRKLNTKTLSKALKTAVTDLRMIEKAGKVSRMIKKENGVLDAIEAIYSQLEYARSLIINKQQSSRPDLARHKFSDGLLATVPLDELLEYRDEDIELEPESGSINDSPINVSLMLKIDHEDDDEEEDESQGGSVLKKKRRSN